MERDTTFWLSSKQLENEGLLETFLREIALQHCKRLKLPAIAGVEFWYNESGEGEDMPWHVDKVRSATRRARSALQSASFVHTGSNAPVALHALFASALLFAPGSVSHGRSAPISSLAHCRLSTSRSLAISLQDEVLMRTSSTMRCPLLATVTYLTTCESLPTVVFGEEESIVSYPVRGNHLAFAGRLVHGVPETLRRGGGRGKKRFVIMVNLWKAAPDLREMGALHGSSTVATDSFQLDHASWKEVLVGPAAHTTVYEDGNVDAVVEDCDEVVACFREAVKGAEADAVMLVK